ncbi:unnamed protein product [Echinostoma caproni]|uniref:PFK domain-containing protein n=1 Tax=Echinostoma caproni TaxID=27848 RepID=A0A182ZZM6_9TREM|nr:unnamed protein product [Echinostoma caproni]
MLVFICSDISGLFSQLCSLRRINVLGHMQQGNEPSPFDRNLGTKFGSKAIDWLHDQINLGLRPDGTVHCPDPSSCTLLGVIRQNSTFTEVLKLRENTDFKPFRSLLTIAARSVTPEAHITTGRERMRNAKRHGQLTYLNRVGLCWEGRLF